MAFSPLPCAAEPFLLGFYPDDWSLLVPLANTGAPFSLRRLEGTLQPDLTRPAEEPSAASEIAFTRTIEHRWPLLHGRTSLFVNPWLKPTVCGGTVIRQASAVHLPALQIAGFDRYAARFFRPTPLRRVDERWWPLLLQPLAAPGPR
ncbi:MAG: hypothetical protein ACUVS7_11725 [Bryobacteraceae bacterium]